MKLVDLIKPIDLKLFLIDIGAKNRFIYRPMIPLMMLSILIKSMNI